MPTELPQHARTTKVCVCTILAAPQRFLTWTRSAGAYVFETSLILAEWLQQRLVTVSQTKALVVLCLQTDLEPENC